MTCSYLKNKKAAAICAAFLFSSPPLFASKKENPATFSDVRQKAVSLLLQKKKDQALKLVGDYTKTSSAAAHRNEATELLVTLAQKFIARDAQEAYENSVNMTLENPKEAWRSNEQCLSLEPFQLECLIQKMRLHLRAKNSKGAAEVYQQIRELIPGSRVEFWLGLQLQQQQGSAEFKNRQIIKSIPDNGGEEAMVLAILELERTFLAKNYSRARDLITFFEKKHPDWPEIIFYKQKIDAESSEPIGGATAEQILVYRNKCKSLNKTTARKFRYDVSLCMRGDE